MPIMQITSSTESLPPRIIIHAPEKFGKSSVSAYSPSPVFLMSKGETGVVTLVGAGRLTSVNAFPECQVWTDVTAAIQELHSQFYKTLVLDTANGLEKMCFDHITRVMYQDNRAAFLAWGKGPDVAVKEWDAFIASLDLLRERKKMAIIALCHTKVKRFNNPQGADFDRYMPDMHERTWGSLHKWSDAIIFGNFDIGVKKSPDEKEIVGKGTGGQLRFLYTEKTAAYDAGNRYGLQPVIPCGESPQEAWANFANAMKAARAASAPAVTTTPQPTTPTPTATPAQAEATPTPVAESKPVETAPATPEPPRIQQGGELVSMDVAADIETIIQRLGIPVEKKQSHLQAIFKKSSVPDLTFQEGQLLLSHLRIEEHIRNLGIPADKKKANLQKQFNKEEVSALKQLECDKLLTQLEQAWNKKQAKDQQTKTTAA